MRVVTWNVNSIRSRLPRLLALLDRHRPDVVLLQETKVEDDAFPHQELATAGWRAVVHGQRTYNGVAILSRRSATEVRIGFPGDPIPEQARVISAEVGPLRLIDAYVVNGKAVGDEKYEIKLRWLDAFADWLAAAHDPSQPLLVAGDFNIAPEDRDVHDPERWRGKVLCSEPERERLRRLLAWGLTDLHRLHEEGPGPFTWWDYRMGAFPRGWGLRIDLLLGTAPVAAACTAVVVDREERRESAGEGKPSDHAPVLADLAL
ncbi:MAG: exodeoxyribonuclease III [Planctomycetota bacterium]|nr:MAG: exodeoxyribonuclease III [Planctomycetota bacterium]